MLRFIFIFLALGIYTVSHAQVTAPSLISAAGDNSSNQEYMLEWSVGEIAVAGFSGEVILTQGIHQGDYILSGIDQLKKDGIDISFYPNPVDEILHISFRNNPSEKIHWQLILVDINSRIILQEKIMTDNHEIDMSAIEPGIYFFNLTTNSGIKRTFKIIKQ